MTWIDVLFSIPMLLAFKMLATVFALERVRNEWLWSHLYEKACMPPLMTLVLFQWRYWTVQQWKLYILKRAEEKH